MLQNIIYTKENKDSTKNYIKITTNVSGVSLYSYYANGNDTPKKTSFNKWSFIEYLKSIKIPKKYIDMLQVLHKTILSEVSI